MSNTTNTENTKSNPPGVCIPWEEKAKEFGLIAGDQELVKNEWGKLDAFAYLYLWFWVHR